jgi:hypothetical protein
VDRKARVRQLGFAIGLLGAMAIIPVFCCHGGLFVGMLALDPVVAVAVAIFLALAWFAGRGTFAVLSSFVVGPALVFVNSMSDIRDAFFYAFFVPPVAVLIWIMGRAFLSDSGEGDPSEGG